MIKGLSIIFMCLIVGEGLTYFLNLSVPGNVIGLVLMFLLLHFGWVKLSDVEETAEGLIKNLALFFVPLVVAVPIYYKYFEKEALAIAGATILSFPITLIISGWVTQMVLRRRTDV